MTAPANARRQAVSLLLAGLAGVALLVLLIGVGETQVSVREVAGDAGSRRLVLGVASCNQNPRVEVEETTTVVSLSVFIDRPGLLDGTDDCRDSIDVTLESPLGTRTVTDTSTGEQVVPRSE